jgi:hypothetical protein
METREDESEIILVEKATSPARNGEIVVSPVARIASWGILFLDGNNNGSNSSQSSIGIGKLFAVDNGVREQEDDKGGIDVFGTIIVSPANNIHLLELNLGWRRSDKQQHGNVLIFKSNL